MEVVFDKKQLFTLLRDFHTIIGLRVGVFDLEYREAAAFPVKISGFCKIIRSRPEGLERCLACDREAFGRARSADPGEIELYQCHAGLTEAAAPIRNGGETLGFLMFGQMRRHAQPQGQWRRLTESLSRLGIDADFLESAFYRLPVADETHVLACARVLQACAVSVWLEECIRLQYENVARRARKYIASHLEQPLPLERICSALDVGKTTLCAQVKKQYGCTVGGLILCARMERAKKLLEQTDEPISVLAERVGIPDYNYFTRVFREFTGETPTAYRKRLRAMSRG